MVSKNKLYYVSILFVVNMPANLRSDTFQWMVMMFGLIVCIIKGALEFPEGLKQVFEINHRFKRLDIFRLF